MKASLSAIEIINLVNSQMVGQCLKTISSFKHLQRDLQDKYFMVAKIQI